MLNFIRTETRALSFFSSKKPYKTVLIFSFFENKKLHDFDIFYLPNKEKSRICVNYLTYDSLLTNNSVCDKIYFGVVRFCFLGMTAL